MAAEPDTDPRTTTVRFTLRPQPPFDLAPTLARFARFPETVDRIDGDRYGRLLLADGAPLLVRVVQQGPPARARLRVELEGRRAASSASRAAALELVDRGLGAAHDLRGFYAALADDPLLGEPIRRFRGLRIAGWPSVWEALVTAILSQQVNLAFAFSIRAELARAFGRRARFDGELWTAFPEPRRIARESAESLRSFRLSAAKARAIHGLAAAFAEGAVSQRELERLDDEAAIARLIAFTGVGRWTAEIALLRGLGRADVFPAADLGVVKYLAQGLLGHRGKATEEQMRRFAERWRPYRGLALVYAYAELARRAATP